VLALETIRGHRVGATPAAIHALISGVPSGSVALRFAPDELFVVPGPDVDAGLELDVDGDHAIVVEEAGFVGCWLDAARLAAVARHIEWPLPTGRPSFAQGYVAGVPTKLWLDADRSLLLCAAPYASELSERLR
jgi:hypothetical protein